MHCQECFQNAIFAHLIEIHLMHRRSVQGLPSLHVLFFILILFSACKATKVVPYFSDFLDTARPAVVKTIPFKNPLIQPDDVLSCCFRCRGPSNQWLFG